MGVITDYLSCTRNLAAYARNTAGVLSSFAIDTLRRTDYGLLVEGERTNNCPQSTTIGVASGGANTWTLNRCAVTTTATTAPDGTLTAIMVTDTAVAGTHGLQRSAGALPSVLSGKVAVSVFAKANTLNFLNMQYGGVSVIFDLAVGKTRNWAITSTTYGIFYDAYVEAYDDDWYRCVMIVEWVSSILFLNLGVRDTYRNDAGNLDYSGGYTGTAAGSIYLWGPQLEEGEFASSYIPTTGYQVVVTRPADDIAFIGAADTLLNTASTNGRSVVADVLLSRGSNAQKIICGSSGTPLLLGQYGTDYRKALTGAVVSGMSADGADFVSGMTVAACWGATSSSCVAALGTVTTGAAPSFLAGTRYIGDGTLFGYVRNIKLWNNQISADELDNWTTFTEPTPSNESSPGTYYFSAVGDRTNLLSQYTTGWVVSGVGAYNWNGVRYNATPFAFPCALPINYPDDWNIGQEPHFHWVNLGADTVSIGSAVTAPDSTSTAKKIVESSSLSEHYIYGANRLDAYSEIYNYSVRLRYSVFLKAGERTRAILVVSDCEMGSYSRGSYNGIKMLVDLVEGVIVDSYEFGEWRGELVDTDIIPWGNGWFRCDIKFSYPSLGTVSNHKYFKAGVIIDAGSTDGDELTYYTGDGSSGLYVWRSNVMFMAADEQIDQRVFHDDFDTSTNIDLNNTRTAGYDWYPWHVWPTLADAPLHKFEEAYQLTSAQITITDSYFRLYPRGTSNPGDPFGLTSACWAGNVTDCRATGEGICDATTPWEEVRELFIGTVYKIPLLAETRRKVVDWTSFNTGGWTYWMKDVQCYLTPYRNPDGTPVRLLWPATFSPDMEYDFTEWGSGSTIHTAKWEADGSYSDPEKNNFADSVYRQVFGCDNTPPYLIGNQCEYMTERTWQSLVLHTTGDDVAIHALFADGMYCGLMRLGGVDRPYSEAGKDNYQILWTGGTGSEVYWCSIWGNATTAVQGLATGPL